MVFFFMMRALHFEKEAGSVSFIYQLTIISFFIQVVYVALAIGLSFLHPPFAGTMSFGIWPLYMWMLTSDAFKNPNRAQNLCCFPI